MSKEKAINEDFLAKWAEGKLSNEELAGFTGSEDNQVFEQILASSDKLAFPIYDVEAELQKLNERKTSTPKGKTVQFPLLRYAAAAVVLIGIALVYYLTLPNYVVYSTDMAQSLLVELPDGSTVNLSANTELKYDPDSYEENRLLKLEGEAYFDVVKGANFEVETSEGNIKVLGTTFNVDQRRSVLNVICYAGKVNVFNASTSSDLLPGDAIRIENGRKTKTWKVIGGEQPGWMNGVTEIHEANLQVAIDALQNVYDISINSTLDLKSIPFDGAFPHNDIEVALRSVLGTGDIDYTYQQTQKMVSIQAKE